MQKYLQQGTSWAPVAVGTRNQPLKELGLTSNPTSQPLTVSTSKCRGKPLLTPDHSANAAMTQNEDQMAEATIGALANLAAATAADRGVVAALTQTNSRLVKQLEENASELR
jgi:hypothetical protein